MLANFPTISSFRSSSRVEILSHFEGRILAKLHCAEYVTETTGRPSMKLKKILIKKVKHTHTVFTLFSLKIKTIDYTNRTPGLTYMRIKY